MAKVYGNNSYLQKKDLTYALLAAGVAVIILAAVLLVFVIVSPLAGGVAAVLAILILVMPAPILIRYLKKQSLKYYRGFSGELLVKKKLSELPEDFSVFCNLQFGDSRGNIDFVVLAPSGLFLLEVKNHKGRIGQSSGDFTIDGRMFPQRNILRQVHGEMWALKNYLAREAGMEIFVNPVIVFSSPEAIIERGLLRDGDVDIVALEFLPDLFFKTKKYNYPVSRNQIEEILRKAC